MNFPKELLFVFTISIACHRSVDLRVNGHTSESYEARISKVGDTWKVSTDLPAGRWIAKLRTEHVPVQVEVIGSRSIASWQIPNDRMVQNTPFVLELSTEGSQEVLIVMELRPRSPGQKFVEGVTEAASWTLRPVQKLINKK